jgi:pleiotropic regulator 1
VDTKRRKMSDEMTVALVSKSIKRTLDMFEPSEGFVRSKVVGEDFDAAQRAKIACRTASEYSLASTKMQAPPPNKSECSSLDHPLNRQVSAMMSAVGAEAMERVMMGAAAGRTEGGVCGGLVLSNPSSRDIPSGEGGGSALVVARRKPADAPEPDWHAPWKLQSVVSSHLGWVRAVAFDPGNEWFVTGSNDRTIKVWDLAKCCVGAPDGLKLTLTGHIHSVRGLAISHRHPYMFSAGEDKKVMCWDLEYNRVIRQYHGHLSAVFTLKLHPTLDVLVTAGRDSAARVWDIRTKQQVHVLASHTDAVGALAVNATDPQIITGSHDCTIKLWDLAAGKVMTTLTHHKKAIRAIAVHDQDEFSFVSAAADNLKKWQVMNGWARSVHIYCFCDITNNIC